MWHPINSFSPTPKLFDDSQIPAFKALADSVHAYGTKLGVQLFHPEYDVDAINSLFMQKKFDEMRQRLHHDMMFFTDEVSEEMLMAIIDKMCACAVRAQKAVCGRHPDPRRPPERLPVLHPHEPPHR